MKVHWISIKEMVIPHRDIMIAANCSPERRKSTPSTRIVVVRFCGMKDNTRRMFNIVGERERPNLGFARDVLAALTENSARTND